MTRVMRHHDDEFKSNAVSLYIGSGKSYEKLGDELGIAASTLVGWVNSGNYHSGSSNRRISEAE